MAEPKTDMGKLAVWLSTPHHAMVEIARDLGYRRFVLDIEHGLFELDATDKLVALIRAMGLEVYAKVLGPEAVPIQQALDMGCDGVIIPHIEGVEHARMATAAAKFPPLGSRSFAGTRTSGYGGAGQDYYDGANAGTRCFPMVESAAALADVEKILALPTVDGVFLGPSDLSLSRGRGAYKNDDADKADLKRVATAAKAAGKPWIMPAWSKAERDFVAPFGPWFMVVIDEYGALYSGLAQAKA